MASIRERPSTSGESTWAVLYRHGKRQASRTFGDRKSAERFRSLVEAVGADRALALLSEERAVVGATLDEVAGQWFDWKAGRRDVTPRVLADYRRDYANWISPHLGHLEAASVTETHVQRLVDVMAARLSPKSVADRHALLHGIYKWAASRTRNIVEHNPCTETELPRRRKTPPKGLRLPEYQALLSAAAAADPDAADLILFLGCTGWRIGEAVALTTAVIEDDGEHVHVTMQRVWRRGSGFVEGGKSEAATRRVRVLGPAVPMLRRRVVGLGPGDPVFTHDGKVWHKTTFRERRWLPIVAAAGLAGRSPTPHWLRHTHVLLCHAAGMSLPEIQRRIGHEHYSTTVDVYGRMIGEVDEGTASRLDALLSGSLTTGEVVPPALD